MGEKKTTPSVSAPPARPTGAPAPAPAPAALAPPAPAAATAAGLPLQPTPCSNETPFRDAGPGTLANKSGEPPLKLGLSVNKIEFKCGEDSRPVSLHVKMHNPTAATATFKVKCTNADIFRVQPPIGCIKPNETLQLVIWYQNQDRSADLIHQKNHYFAFYHTRTDGRTAREVWAAGQKMDGVRRLPVVFSRK